jgi:hypothetical protein
LDVFPEYLRHELGSGRVYVDTTHVVADEKMSGHYWELPYVTLQPRALAAFAMIGGEGVLGVALNCAPVA